ncbi:MAG: chloride channel protein, partial [Kiritimatiellia bacterium]
SVISYTLFAAVYGWEPIFKMPAYAFENGMRLIPYFVLALVVTFGVRFYISVFRGVERWFSARPWPVEGRVAAGGLLVGAIGFVCPDILGSSYSIIQASFTAGESDLFAHYGTLTILGFLSFFFIKALATAFTVGSGGSGGVFAPALVCGGSLGAATGLFFKQVLPTSVGIHPAAFALVGMAAFLASAIRVPLTAVVMVAEISGNHELLLPTMWACGISFWLNNGWSLYRSQVHCRDSSPLH